MDFVTKQYVKVVNASRNEEGQGLVEYGLILALIAVAVVTTVGLIGDGADNTFNTVKNNLGGGGGTP